MKERERENVGIVLFFDQEIHIMNIIWCYTNLYTNISVQEYHLQLQFLCNIEMWGTFMSTNRGAVTYIISPYNKIWVDLYFMTEMLLRHC